MLGERFSNRGFRIETKPEVCIVFPAVNPIVGDIQICDDGHEITIYIGSFTHGHFACYDDIPDEQKAKLISEDVVEFLDAVFSDQVAFWGSHQGGGGWRRLDSVSAKASTNSEYVWSGRKSI
jgi:hypothetical protein